MHTDTIACLGKIPSHGDFVRHHASTPTMRAFDEWLRTGLHHVRQTRPEAWEAAYDAAPTRRFLFWGDGPQHPTVLLGVLRPSRDEGGRRYPFMVTCEVPKQRLRARHAVYLPVQADAFFDAAEPVVRAATDGSLARRDVTEQVQDLSGVPVRPTVPRNHKRYLQDRTTGGFLEDLFGHFDDSEKYRLFGTLFEALGSRADDRPEGMQFPLLDGEEAPVHVVAFWAELVRRLLDADRPPSLFWTGSAAEAASPPLLLYPDPPAPRVLADVLGAAGDEEHVLPVQNGRAQRAVEAALSIPEAYGELLERAHLRLWDFLHQI